MNLGIWKTKEQKENRKKEVQEARKELLDKGVGKYFVDLFVDEWKQNPIKSILTFIFWVLISFSFFAGVKWVIYDATYCYAYEFEHRISMDTDLRKELNNHFMEGYYFDVIPKYNEIINRTNAIRLSNPTQHVNSYELHCNGEWKRWYNKRIRGQDGNSTI